MRLAWVVLDWNTPAIRFYERLGAEFQRTWLLTHLGGAALDRLALAPRASVRKRRSTRSKRG